MYLTVFGNHPGLSRAELLRLHPEATSHSDVTATLKGTPRVNLGGCVKSGPILADLPLTEPGEIQAELLQRLPDLIAAPDVKIPIGLSVYGQRWPGYKQFCFKLKKELRRKGYKPRIVLGKHQTLNTAQVLHNQLTQKGVELILSIGPHSTLIAKTEDIQDIDSYTKRDIQRPCRDMETGMLPPKLAQIMNNLANGSHVFDPFCGSGVILQEALIAGKTASGSDIDSRMVDCTRKNLEWLRTEYGTAPPTSLFTADAREVQVPPGVDALVSEGYLGPIITKALPRDRLEQLAREADTLMRTTLESLHAQLTSATTLCLALPAWRHGRHTITPPLVDDLPSLGYNQLRLPGVTRRDLLYRRPDQFVGRQLIVLKKD